MVSSCVCELRNNWGSVYQLKVYLHGWQFLSVLAVRIRERPILYLCSSGPALGAQLHSHLRSLYILSRSWDVALWAFFTGCSQSWCLCDRVLAHAIEGWMQNLELGVSLGLRDINTLCPAIRKHTVTLNRTFLFSYHICTIVSCVLQVCLKSLI